LVGEALVGEALVGEALVREALNADSLVGEALVGEALVGEALVGEALVGEALVGEALVRQTAVDGSVGKIAQDTNAGRRNDDEPPGASVFHIGCLECCGGTLVQTRRPIVWSRVNELTALRFAVSRVCWP